MLGIGNYLWRLIPANPILLRVVESGGKRKRDLLIRCAYLGVLLFVVVVLLLNAAGELATASLARLTQTSTAVFYWLSHVQLGLVALLAPIFTAGAITQEKDSQTYDILLATPLSNGQIVLGSLLSRLFFIVALLVSGIPIFSITQIFGGVAIRDITTAFLIASATAFVTGALAMAIAVFKVGTRRTIFSFYLFIMLYLAIPLVLESMGYCQYRHSYDSQGKFQHISWFAGMHPFLAQRVIFSDPTYQPPDMATVRGYGRIVAWYLSSPHTFYVSFMFFLSFVLIAPSVMFLRRLAQASGTLQMWVMKKLHLSTGDKTRKPRHVWGNPIAWREAKTKASASRSVSLRYGFMLLGVGAAVVLLVLSSRTLPMQTYIATAYDPEQKSISIDDGGEVTTYLIRDVFDRQFQQPPTDIRMDQNQQIQPADLRAGLAVDPSSLQVDNRPGRRTLVSIKVSKPVKQLSEKATRQFLLGAMMVELAVILLILTQSAASTVTREKEDGTLDLLLASPITSRYYIWGKLRGLVSFVLPLIAVPIASILMFVIRDAGRAMLNHEEVVWTILPESVLILPATLIMVCAFAAILGMQMSLRCRRTVMAVMSSVGIVGGICGALWVCGMQTTSGAKMGQLGAIFGCFSPFTLMELLMDPGVAGGESWIQSGDATSVRVFVFIFGWAAAGAYAAVVWQMYRSMVRNFDMTIRKQAQ